MNVKVIRNSIFTALAVTLTVIAVDWNKEIARQRQPIAISQAVLAAQNPSGLTIDQAFPLSINFSRDEVKLGQYQEIIIRTVPFAELDIVTQYPDGSVSADQTFQAKASEGGEYRFRFKLDSFEYLGVFRISIAAYSDNKVSEASNHFLLKTWVSDELNPSGEGNYVYPLVP
jgi:hypothetical protein